MSSVLIGKDIIIALNELRNPANVKEILDHLSVSNKFRKTSIDTLENILKDGVRLGYVMQRDSKYSLDYVICNNEQHNQPKDTETNTRDEEKRTSSNELHSSSESGVMPKAKRTKIANSSDDEDDNDVREYDDCYGMRSRRSKRSRSRSSGRRRKSRRRRSHA